MDLFSDFCNICYKVNDGNLKDISEDNVKHLKDILITFVGHADIVKHNKMYLCQSCCEELIHFEKFKEMCFTHLIQLRQTYFNMLTELEVENDSAAVKNKLKRFVHENVLRSNCFATSNCSVSVATKHEIIKSSENLNVNEPVFNKQLINLRSQRSESEFDCDYRVESVINNVTECHETISSEEIKSEKFESEFKEDFDVCDINNANVRDTSKIEFTKEEFDEYHEIVKSSENLNSNKPVLNHQVINLQSQKNEREFDGDVTECDESRVDVSDINNANVSDTVQIKFMKEDFDLNNDMDICDSEHFKLNILENELSEHANSDLKVPVVNSGTYPTEQDLHVKQEKSDLKDLELKRTEEEFGGGLNVAFEIANVRTIVNIEDSGHENIRSKEAIVGMKLRSRGCNNKSIASIMNSQHTTPRVRQHRHGRCPRSATSGVYNRVNPAGKPHMCTVCNKPFTTSSSLRVHERIHSGERPYKCTVCNKAFRQSSDLSVHKRIHSGDRPYKCTVCSKAFRQSSDLSVHKRIHSGDRPYKCTCCNKTFKLQSRLISHERTHNRPYKCTVCNKVFTASSSLLIHERIHSGERPYKCTVCNKAFRQSSHLIKHKRIHSGDRPYKCTVCNKAFRQMSTLIKHKRIHSGDRPYKCTVCNKAFRQSSDLSVHKRIHSDDRPYKCTCCNKTFKLQSRLILHERTHNRPYKCTVCNKAFTASSSLLIHERIHSGERPYKCTVCKKTFKRSYDLSVHTRIHSGERPYKCTCCNKTFTQSSSLIVHERTHSGH